MNLDYSHLTRPVTRENRQDLRAVYPKTHPAVKVIIIIIVSFVSLVAALTVAATIFADPSVQSTTYGLVIGGVYVAALVTSWIVLKRQANRRVRVFNFAQAHNITLLANVTNPDYPGIIFRSGSNRRISEAFRFADGREIGVYHHMTGTRRRKIPYRWTYIKAKLSRHLPHMILDSRVNNLFGGRISNLPSSLAGTRVLSLEGDFDKYFTLHVPPGYERDALYIFTPDVMSVLVQHGAVYDIEVIDDTILFYTRGAARLDKESFIRDATAIVDAIGREMIDQSEAYIDERVRHDALETIAEPGRRLRPKGNVLTRIVSWIIFFAMIYLFIVAMTDS